MRTRGESRPVRKAWRGGRSGDLVEVEIVVSYEPLENPGVAGLPDKVKGRLPELRFALDLDARLVMEELKYYAVCYPEVPCFENWLAKALYELGRREEARSLAERTLKRHPDYVWGNLLVAQFALWDGDLERAGRLLGRPRIPQSLAPGREVFHVSEAVGYFYLCAQLDLLRDDLHGALASLALIEEVAPDDAVVEELRECCEALEADLKSRAA